MEDRRPSPSWHESKGLVRPIADVAALHYYDSMSPTKAPEVTALPGYEHQRFRINGGDGDQALFSEPKTLQRVTAPWFDGNLGQLFGDSWLVRVIEGRRTGLMLALTPRTLGEIADGITQCGWKSVVVHGIDFPGYDPISHGPRSIVGGMSALELLQD